MKAKVIERILTVLSVVTWLAFFVTGQRVSAEPITIAAGIMLTALAEFNPVNELERAALPHNEKIDKAKQAYFKRLWGEVNPVLDTYEPGYVSDPRIMNNAKALFRAAAERVNKACKAKYPSNRYCNVNPDQVFLSQSGFDSVYETKDGKAVWEVSADYLILPAAEEHVALALAQVVAYYQTRVLVSEFKRAYEDRTGREITVMEAVHAFAGRLLDIKPSMSAPFSQTLTNYKRVFNIYLENVKPTFNDKPVVEFRRHDFRFHAADENKSIVTPCGVDSTKKLFANLPCKSVSINKLLSADAEKELAAKYDKIVLKTFLQKKTPKIIAFIAAYGATLAVEKYLTRNGVPPTLAKKVRQYGLRYAAATGTFMIVDAGVEIALDQLDEEFFMVIKQEKQQSYLDDLIAITDIYRGARETNTFNLKALKYDFDKFTLKYSALN